MIAEIISIGDEILIGQIVNNNAAWIAQQLNMIGISVNQISTVGDNREQLLRVFSETSNRADIILITGGLGPTNDDITKPCLCEYFNTKLKFSSEIFEDIKKLFSDRGLPMPEINRTQAEIPENCIPIKNIHGTAPGMFFIEKNKMWFSLPGVPHEMKAMMNNFVIPELKIRCGIQSIIHKTVYTHGMSESALAEKIKDWENSLWQDNIKLAYLPSPGMVKLRLSARNNSQKIDEKIQELKKIIPKLIFAVEEFGKEPETIEKTVGKLLREKNKTLAIAESCTGGYISHLITRVPGSSDYFKGGIISYSNEIKIYQLGVNEATLKEKGAVSKETALQMAEGIRKRMKSDFGIGVTGIAGPLGGTSEKPIGTVWIAVSCATQTVAEKFLFGNDRELNIIKSGLSALNMLRIMLEKTHE